MSRKSVLDSWFSRGLGFLIISVFALNAWAGNTNISVGNASVTVGGPVGGPVGAAMNFPITRTGDLSYDVYLNYQTIDGTAVAGKDYMPTAGSLLLPAGISNTSLPVRALGSANQLNKSFTMQFLGGSVIAPKSTFFSGNPLMLPSGLYSLASADLMGNGHQDIITADGSVWLGDGNGNFIAGPAVTPATSLALADINGDGKPDLIEAFSSNQIAVFINTTNPGDAVPSFAAPQYFNTGNGSIVIVVADFNGDGMSDIAILDTGINAVDVLINTTVPGSLTPTFSNFQSFSAGANATWLAAADLNGDGKPDLVVANNLDSTISVFINTTAVGGSTPNFLAQQVFPVGNMPNMVALADVNGDGVPDVVVANDNENFISLLLNTTPANSSTVSFATEKTFATGDTPDSLVVIDVDGDGRPDVVTGNAWDNTVSMFINTTANGASTASFATEVPFAVGTQPENLIAADFNGDGKPDLAVLDTAVQWATGQVSILLNTTSPAHFMPPQTFSVGNVPNMVVAGDINRDGKPDIVVANNGEPDVSILLNTTTTGSATVSFSPEELFATVPNTSVDSVALADMNGDGLLDVIAANSSQSSLSVLLNTTPAGAAAATFLNPQTFPVGSTSSADPEAVVAVDLNGDGKPDLATLNYSEIDTSTLINTTPTGSSIVSFGPLQETPSTSNVELMTSADLNGDGKQDLIFGDGTLLINTTPIGSSSTSFTLQQSLDANPQAGDAAVADFNGDGLPDVVLAEGSNPPLQVDLNTSAVGANVLSFSPQVLNDESTLTVVATADFNGDGKPDIVTTDGNGTVLVYTNLTPSGSATTSFASPEMYTVGTYPISITTADINGDGKPDIIVADLNNSVSVLLNTWNTIPVTPSSVIGTIGYSINPPVITITGPSSGFETSNQTIIGYLSSAGSLSINGTYVPLNPDHSFSESVTIPPGGSQFTFVARDLQGNITTLTQTFTLAPPSLSSPIGTLVQFQTGPSGTLTLVGQPGAAVAGEGVTVTDVSTGQTALGTVNSDGSISVNIAGIGADNFSVVLNDGSGNISPTIYLHGNDPALSLTVTSPSNGASITGNTVNVTGTYTGPLDIGITVNGMPAVLINGGFYLNNVPLTAGSNTLAVIATTLGGLSTTQTLAVTSSGISALAFATTSEYVGIGSLSSVDFNFQYSSSAALQTLQVSYNGGGSYSTLSAGDDFPSNQDSVSLVLGGPTYTTPGAYPATVIATDVNGVQYQAVTYVIVQDPDQFDTLFSSVWGDLTMALSGGNKPAAMNNLDYAAQQNYGSVFDSLMPTMPTIVSSFSPLMESTLNSSTAEYIVGRSQNGQDNLYFVYFVMGSDGVWRLESM